MQGCACQLGLIALLYQKRANGLRDYEDQVGCTEYYSLINMRFSMHFNVFRKGFEGIARDSGKE